MCFDYFTAAWIYHAGAAGVGYIGGFVHNGIVAGVVMFQVLSSTLVALLCR
jgi:hypothetical protein